jgi:hypothetical protein
MSSTQMRDEHSTPIPSAAMVDLNSRSSSFRVDVDRAKRFYASLGWRLDADFAFDNGFRVVQFTPPGSACSVQFGTNITSAAPGSAQGLYLVVSESRLHATSSSPAVPKAARCSTRRTPGAQFQRDGAGGRVSGPRTRPRQLWLVRHVHDPDGNSCCSRRSRRGSRDEPQQHRRRESDRASARGRTRHGEYEPTAPKHHWSEWYAAYIVARERGRLRGGSQRWPRSTGRTHADEARHRPGRRFSRLRAFGPPRRAPQAL